ncbi:hypothetical protein HDK90DRAFT_536865 [Phyllosticta capitalensis]|uniref:Uncharacterized protein n=1 Tax=Phyllosticta capitalensis TaxID=121624 RepID=A0ABR1YCX4_9PEZI
MVRNVGKERPKSFWLRPIDFETWRVRSDRAIELRNFNESPFFSLPREIRNEIYRFALVNDEPVRFFADLCTSQERQFGREHHQVGGLTSIYLMNLFNNGFNIDAIEADDEDEYFGESIMYDVDGKLLINQFRVVRDSGWSGGGSKRHRAAGLFTVSRAVHRESMHTMYKETRFIFPDVYGFVGLQRFFQTIGHRSLAHLRKLTVHLPPWNFNKPMDHARSNIIYASARALGLREPGCKPRDRLLGAFRRVCDTILALNPGLQELDLIVAPYSAKHYEQVIAPANLSNDDDDDDEVVLRDADIFPVNKHRNPKYAARAEAEEHYLKQLSTLAPRLKVRFLALEYTTKRTPQLDEAKVEEYWRQVEQKCRKWGFEYVKLVDKTDWDDL